MIIIIDLIDFDIGADHFIFHRDLLAVSCGKGDLFCDLISIWCRDFFHDICLTLTQSCDRVLLFCGYPLIYDIAIFVNDLQFGTR